MSARIEHFDFSHAALGLYDFVYGELCDWYLELVKPRLRAGEPELAATLLHVLTETVALAHPLIPFETEEIYSHIPGAEGLLAARVSAPPATGSTTEAETAVQRRSPRCRRSGAGATWPASRRGRCCRPAGGGRLRRHLRSPGRLARAHAGRARGAVATVPVPGRQVEILASPEVDPARPRAGWRPSGSSRRDRARRAQALQPGLRRQGAAEVVRPNTTSSSASGELEAL